MTQTKLKKPESILEAISDLEEFYVSDIWYASKEEWKSEQDMQKYINRHFAIVRMQVIEIMNETNNFDRFFKKNLVYCTDTHSFVHRLFDCFKENPDMSKNQIQNKAFKIIEQINQEYRDR